MIKMFFDVILKLANCFVTSLSIDKPVKSGTALLSECFTYKGGVFDKQFSGDKLQKQIAQEKRAQTDEQNQILREISSQLSGEQYL